MEIRSASFKQCRPCKNMNNLLEKAKRDYPIGTKFRSLFDVELKHNSSGVIDDFKGSIYVKDEYQGWWRCIYDRKLNQWAEIINTNTMFKKGDYIVTLINDGDCGKVDYCSKQNEDSQDLCPEIDTKGIKDNGNGRFTFSDKSGLKWRFATKEEGEEYERQGKPYNVTNIVKKNMTQQEFNALRVGDFISNYEILHKYKEFLIVRCDDGHDLFDLEKINKLGLKIKTKTFMGLEVKEYDNVPCEVDGNELCYLVSVTQDSILCSVRKNGCVLCCVPTSIRIL